VLRTASIMAEGAAEIDVEHLPDDFMHDCEPARDEPLRALSAVESSAPSRPARMEELQATLIEQTLARNNGNISAAARELGLARNTVYRYMRIRTTH
jgi:transcriptional regulator of acetoin/glycerol metabolism